MVGERPTRVTFKVVHRQQVADKREDGKRKQTPSQQFSLRQLLAANHGHNPHQIPNHLFLILERLMEAARRRLTVFCSHFRPVAAANSHCVRIPCISPSNCSSSLDSHDDDKARISDEEDTNIEKRCVFCRIVRGESPAFKIYEDENCLCILDMNPLIRGHSLLIPKNHCCSLDATPPTVIAAMCSKIPFISKAIMKVTGCESFNLLVNNGAAAGQVIFHTHIHIIPRKAQDYLWASESLRRLSLKLDKEASQLAESIRERISFFSSEEDHEGPN